MTSWDVCDRHWKSSLIPWLLRLEWPWRLICWMITTTCGLRLGKPQNRRLPPSNLILPPILAGETRILSVRWPRRPSTRDSSSAGTRCSRAALLRAASTSGNTSMNTQLWCLKGMILPWLPSRGSKKQYLNWSRSIWKPLSCGKPGTNLVSAIESLTNRMRRRGTSRRR